MISALILTASTLFSIPLSIDNIAGLSAGYAQCIGVSVAQGFARQSIGQGSVYPHPEVGSHIAQGLGSKAVGSLMFPQ